MVRKTVDHLEADRDPQPDIASALKLVRSGLLAGLVDEARVGAERSG
jgi:histidine ammonia-lyase